MSTESLKIRITAEFAQLRSSIQNLESQLKGVKRAGDQVGIAGTRGLSQVNQKLQSTGRTITGLLASLGAGLSVAGLSRASDEAQMIAARLRLATRNSDQFATAQREVFNIAQRTRTSLSASVDLYARIERSTRAQKVNQATILKLTETINQAAQISGGGPGAEAALFQLSQGLASGTLRGEELNSVLEQTPRLAEAIASGMNVPIGKIRQLAEDGKLTSEAVLKSILSQSKTIQAEFAEFPPTIASGFTAIRNAFVQYLQTSNQANSSSRAFAEALQKIAEHLPAIIDGFIRFGPVVLAVYAAFKLWPAIAAAVAIAQSAIARFTVQVAALSPVMTAASVQARALSASIATVGPASALAARGAVTALGLIRASLSVLIAAFAGWQIGRYLSEQFLEVRIAGIAMVTGLMKAWENIKAAVKIVGLTIKEVHVQAFNYVIDKAASFYKALGKAAGNIPGIGDAAASTFNGYADSLSSSKIQAEGLANAVKRVAGEAKRAKDEIDKVGGEMVDYETRAETGKNNKSSVGGDIGIPGGASTDGGKSAQQAAKLAAINADLIKDAVDRAIKHLDRLYEDSKISMVDYFAEKQRLEIQSIDASIAAAEAEKRAAKETDEVAAANAKITMLMRDRKQVAIDTIREQKKAEEELTRQLGALQIRLLQANGETGRAARAQLEEEFRDLILKLQAEGDEAGVALARKVINIETFTAQLDQVKTKVSEAMTRFNATEAATGAQVNAGILGQSDASSRVNDQRVASLEILKAQRAELVKLRDDALLAEDALSMQRASDALTEIDGQIAQLSLNTESFGYKTSQVLQSSLTTLFTDLAEGSKSASEALRDFVLNFVKGMAQIAAQALATYLTLQLLDMIYPGLGKATAAGMAAGANHSGGMAGSGGTRRMMPALMIAGAPRYHSGGIAGLGADEVPAVLKKNEEVLTRSDPRHRYNGGLDGQPTQGNLRFIFIDDERQIDNYLNAPESDEVFINKLRRNGGSVREIVQGGI